MSDTCDVPLLEVLDSVPLNGRAVWMVSTTETRNIPYGNICQQAAMRIRQLERELAEAKDDSKMWMDVAMARLVSVEHYHTESLAFQEQLTAHKAALEKCEKALFATWADLDHLNHWMPTPCRELYMEALSEIAKLKGTK